MKKSHYNIIIRFLVCICLISILFTSCTIPFSVDKARSDSLEYIDTSYSGDNLHKINANAYTSVCKSGFIELLFDEATATIAIRDNNTKKVWNTLPSSEITKKISASAIEITLSTGNKICTLNSQDNSVNFGNFSYTIGVDEVSVKYAFSLDKETGTKDIKDVGKGEIRADMTVIYKLKDGSLYVNVNMNSVALPKGVHLEKVTVLNNFGAYEEGAEDDYIFVPDGSGALIMTGYRDESFSPVSLSVYGDNLATSKTVSDSKCLLGAFGLKSGENAYLCIIEKGDAIAQINAYRNDENSLNSVYASFLTTDIYTNTTGNKVTRYYGHQYNSEIQLCYRFLSGKSATYSGMATTCRENLIRNNVLPAKTLTPNSDHIPMIVSVQAGYQDDRDKYNVLSDFEQTLSLMTLLKAKGVNNIYLQYKGLYENANNEDFDNFKSSLGKSSDYEALYNYLNSQKFSLFIDTGVISEKENSSVAKSIDGKAVKYDTSNVFSQTATTRKFLKVSNFENRINNILNTSESVLFDGYCLNDIGKHLYSDYSGNSYSKNQTQTEFYSQIPVLATNKMLMIEHGNFYTLKGADIILYAPTTPLAYKENPAYIGIPFIQMLVHGALEYSISPLNTVDDIQSSFLKSVEYGCLPSAYWYCTTFDEKQDNNYYYNNNINEMVKLYTKANQSLATLRDARMTSHEKIQTDVYCTEYDNSIKVYVNYTNTEVTVHGVVIGAKDCVTIS